MMRAMELENRTVVVTGASRGVGAGIAEVCHGRGMKLGVCSRSGAALPDGERVVSSCFDIGDGEATEEFCRRVEERFGHIDLWINNAGMLAPIRPLRRVRAHELRRHLEVNVVGVFNGSRAYVNHVRRTGKPGVLINISSGAARKGYAGWSAYCAGKAAVDRMSECIAIEEEQAGLRVHAVAPGIIDTDMQALIRSTSADDFPEVEKFHQLKRDHAFSTVGDVARGLLRLAFDPGDRVADVLTDLRD